MHTLDDNNANMASAQSAHETPDVGTRTLLTDPLRREATGSLSTSAPKTISSFEGGTKNISLSQSPLDPKEYREEYADEMLQHFLNHEPFYIASDTHYFRDGSSIEKERQVPNPPPSFVSYARKVGVTSRQLIKWAKISPRFAESMAECNEIIKEYIIENGITGKYSSQFAIFVAKNVTDMKDKTEHTVKKVNVNKLMDQIQAAPTPAALKAADQDDIYETEF